MPFNSFIGNPKALASVREMVAGGRVSGSLLFSGPDGVGKKTLARMLAKALVCERSEGDFCDACPRCRKAEEMFVSGKNDAAFGDQMFLTVWANVKGIKIGFKSTDGGTGDYSSEWNDHRVWDNRTSLITDPEDGRIPPVTARAQAIGAEMMKAMLRPAEGPEDRPLTERCITTSSPAIGAGYQSYFQIVQTPAAVMMMTEMFHDVRVINIDNRPHPSANVQEWMGDSRGHWEGNTLVVDTTNYKPRAFQGISSEKLHITERISRQDAETLRWEITVNDPDTWTKPWSIMIPLQRSSQPVYEYACHEGNYGLAGILAGARADEAKLRTSK